MDPSVSSDATTLSPTPFSPFSSAHSFGSETGTSDEPADLGHFAGIFRALSELQNQPREPRARGSAPQSNAPTTRHLARTAPASRAHSRVRASGSTPTVATVPLSDDEEDETSDEADGGEGRWRDTVWAQDNIADYLSSSSNQQGASTSHRSLRINRSSEFLRSVPNLTSYDAEEGELVGGVGDLELDHEHGGPTSPSRPSLGGFDDVLVFLAEERAKHGAKRAEPSNRPDRTLTNQTSKSVAITRSSSHYSTSESALKNGLEPRRKRRRRRGKQPVTSTNATGPGSGGGGASGARRILRPDMEEEVDDDADGSSYEYEPEADAFSSSPTHGKSATSVSSFVGSLRSSSRLPRKDRQKQKQLPLLLLDRGAGAPKLLHSRSTPSLRTMATASSSIVLPPDGRMLPMRNLVTKLRLFFPEDKQWLSSIRWFNYLDSPDFLDPRGRPFENSDPLVHIFIDHSNILIGFINYLKRTPTNIRRTKTHLSHAALALVLERGRPISRRVLVTSSPLYQPMESAEQLGYEVRIYARVPDTGSGADRSLRAEREKERNVGARTIRKNGQGRGHSRNLSAGGTTGESDSGPGGIAGSPSSPSSMPSGRMVYGGQSSQANASTVAGATGSGIGSGLLSPTRVRYREQGVDELLQLKLLQAVADIDTPPRGSTIVLATGDGNVGQFNEEGFLGCVRTALKKGWRVELYAWVVGLSKAWQREFGDGPYKDRFRIVELENFGLDLLDLS